MAKKAAPKPAEAKPEPKAPEAKAAPKKGAKAAPAPAPPKKAATKVEIFTRLSERTGIPKKDISSVFDAMGEEIAKDLGKKGPGLFVIPGLLKLKLVRKEATKEKQGINPFTKEPMTVKAKPARNVVKAVPLKALKDIV
ncbi:HU family DNA-binding protein [Tundrisphaera sp. TA3]|uniref:HU family DNA-binding protein n=1 Tax=Tundrisphaera sp. TA3 TaxID=3435775 RepID=UPI003EC095D7